ncbi:hypothetical protein THAOC_33187 [Thalassiosira oceanica]|uniref:protein-tyrosine-phosphatase n=1 Tax=Thalassiosira oceanica TaxID=159749 RepID=K0R7L8_THAOC|nr:hypothetical protein THAOC_33187 [Thalassiosira oceanica]|eukprot:EJK48054.1 hypothetical protein THAOC_33187 [Thalassiosira oceanica]
MMPRHGSPYVDDDDEEEEEDLELTEGDEFSNGIVRPPHELQRSERGPPREVCAGRRQQQAQEDAVPPVAGADDLDRDRRLRCRARAPRDPAQESQELLKSNEHANPEGEGVLDASESYGKDLTMNDIIVAAATDDADTPADYVFESSIDISGMTQKDKLLLTTLARYDFMRDGMTQLIEEDYIDVVRSPDAHRKNADFYMVDAALEAMKMYLKADYEPVEIQGHPFMYLGSVGAALNDEALEEYGITDIIDWSMTSKCNLYDEKFDYMCIYGVRSEADFWHNLQKLDAAVDLIEQVRRRRGSVLVHCWYGKNRSVSTLIAYLMKYEGMEIDAATELLVDARRFAEPYTGALRKYSEKYLKYLDRRRK